MASKKKQNKIMTVIYIVAVILLLVALVGIIVALSRSDKPPSEDGTLSVSIDGNAVQSGTSAGITPNDTEITVEGVSEFSITVYAYSSADNDFKFTVGGEEYSWSGINNRNMTKGFTFEQTENGVKISYGGVEQIISAVQGGAEVTVLQDIPDKDIFRLTVSAGDAYSDIYFTLGAKVSGVVLDKTQIIL